MMISEIPTKPRSQFLKCTIGGIKYQFNITWRGACYVLDILDSNGNNLLMGLAMVTGSNYLHQFSHLNIPGVLGIVSDGDVTNVPGYVDLGITSHLCSIL